MLLDPTWTLSTPASSHSLLWFAFASCVEVSPQFIRSALRAWAESPKCLEGDFPPGGPWLILWLMLWKLENPAPSPQVGKILKPHTPESTAVGWRWPPGALSAAAAPVTFLLFSVPRSPLPYQLHLVISPGIISLIQYQQNNTLLKICFQGAWPKENHKHMTPSSPCPQ